MVEAVQHDWQILEFEDMDLVLTPPFTSCVTLDKPLPSLNLWFFHL